MIRVPTILCILGLSLSAASLTQQERDRLLTQLDQSAKTFLKALGGVSNAQWNYKPAPDRWSIAECAEHVVIADQMMFTLATQQLMKMPVADNPQHRSDDAILAAATDRTVKVKTADFLEPKGRYASRTAVIEAFQEGRAKIIGYVKTTQDDLRAHGLQSPNGYTDAYQFLLSMSAHAERHSQQIAEVKAVSGYPKQ